MYKKILKSLKKKEDAVKGMVDQISTPHRPHSFQKTHLIFSAENPLHPATVKLTHEEVVKMLKKKGYDVEEMTGKYGGNPERSIMVKNAKPKHNKHFHDLARKLGQDSIIFSDGHNHEMHFLGNDKIGQHAKGTGTDWTDHEPEDNFSRLPNGKYFLHNFNHDQTHGGRSFLDHKHEDEIQKGERKLDDIRTHPLHNQHPNINLVHYSPTEKLNIIDPGNHGVRGIGSEAKQGAPEHKTSFFYLEGVQPESIVTSGSKSKYVTRLGNKKLYDISSDKDNLFSHAQKLADQRQINPGAVRREDFHAAIRNAGYHGIYNSGLDGTMGHVVAMFEPMEVEHEHPIHPNDFNKVDVKNHHAEDAKTFKHPIHPNFYDWHDGHTDHHELPDNVKPLKKDEKQIAKPLQQATQTNNQLESHPHNNAHGPAQTTEALPNEQAGGVSDQSFHNVMQHYGTMNKGKQSNLKFYKDMDKHSEGVDKMLADHGFTHYYAGGKFGKPDLANKNYNTKHLMVYDPTPQSGGDFGDQKYTDAWRKSHELAHALTYPEVNSLYGEGRRLGKLGVRSPNEMKRAVHWEWLAAHKQRDLMKDLGYHMHDDDFHRELNTVMGDAVHRSVTGKFTEPSEMGFQPHSHKVPLHHALSAIDAHAKELGLEHDHDTLAEMRKRKGLTKSERKSYKEIQEMIPDVKYNTHLPEESDHELVSLPVSSVDSRGMIGNSKKAAKYSKMPSESAPPIIVDSQGKIVDGLHRHAAAQQRGDTHIKAYKPVEKTVKASGKSPAKAGKAPVTSKPKAPKYKSSAAGGKVKVHPAPEPEVDENAAPEEPKKSVAQKEIEKVRGTLEDLATDKQSTAGIFSRIYSIPSQNKMQRSKTAVASGQVPSTINVYGSHYPVVRMLEDGKTLLLHTSPYGTEGKTQELVDKIKKELPGIYPEARVVEIHHPDYRHSAKVMRMRDHSNVHKYLEDASKNHPDENYRQHAIEALEHLRGMKKAEYGKPIHAKRTEGEGWDYQANLKQRMDRIHTYLTKVGLTPDMSDEHGRSLGAGGATNVGINLHGDPHDQQTLHEAAHAMLTPMGTTVQEYQQQIGKPGFQGKITQTQNAAALKATHGGSMPEITAQHMEAGIARRSGIEPFRSPARGSKADSSVELGRQHAKKTLELFDEGIQSFDPFTGVNEPGSSVDAVINARARGDKGIFNRVHNAFKQRKAAEKETTIEHMDVPAPKDKLTASEKDVTTTKPFNQHPRDWYRSQAKKKAQAKKLVNGKKPLDAAMDKLNEVKKEEDLQKGSLQRKMPFNPKKTPIDERVAVEGWTDGSSNVKGTRLFPRKDVPEISNENAKKRAMNKLHKLTEVRKHPETGERMFLLHRGMSPTETNHKEKTSSWSPNYDIAEGFARNYKGKVKSAWIPESQIHHIPNSIGSTNKIAPRDTETPKSAREIAKPAVERQLKDKKPLRSNPLLGEHEIIVKPHDVTYAKYTPKEILQSYSPVDDKINHRQKQVELGRKYPNSGMDFLRNTNHDLAEQHGQRKKLGLETNRKEQAAKQAENTKQMEMPLAASEKTQMNAIQGEHLDSKMVKPISARYKKKYGLDKGEGKNFLRAGAVALAMAHGAHYMDKENKESVNPKPTREIASEPVDPNQSAIEQARENARREGDELLRNNYIKSNRPSPIVIKETLKKHPDLQQKYDFATKLSLPALKEVADNHPSLNFDVGVRHYENLKGIFGEDHEKIAQAYKFGVNSTKQKYNMAKPLKPMP
jgi:hypothetical protein